MIDANERNVFIEKSISKAISYSKPLIIGFAKTTNFQNFCDIYREDKREEAERIPNKDLESWANNLKYEFRHIIEELKFTHALDYDSKATAEDVKKRMAFMKSSEED